MKKVTLSRLSVILLPEIKTEKERCFPALDTRAQGHEQSIYVQKYVLRRAFKVVLGRAGAWKEPGSRQSHREREESCCPGPHFQAASAGLGRQGQQGLQGLQNSLQRPAGLGQDSLLKLGIPWEEGSVYLRSSWGWGSS